MSVLFIIQNLFIRQLPVIIDQIEVLPGMQGKVRGKNRCKIFIQRIEDHMGSLSFTGIDHGVTEEKRKIECLNLPGFQQPAEGCTAKIHFYKIRMPGRSGS